jgi:tetratricopeptide (TPR) repeat protein
MQGWLQDRAEWWAWAWPQVWAWLVDAWAVFSAIPDPIKNVIALALLGVIGAVALHVRARAKRAARGDKLAILVCDLDGDKSNGQKKHVMSALEDQFGDLIETIPLPQTFGLDPNKYDQARKRAEVQAQKWLKRKRCDVMLWGRVSKADHSLEIRFTPKLGAGAKRDYALQSAPLAPIKLPLDFGADLAVALGGVAAAAAAPAVRDSGTYLVTTLKPVAAKLRPLVFSPPPGLSGEGHAQIAHAFALAQDSIGRQGGDATALEDAVTAYEIVLQHWTREKAPLQWAGTQNNLGAALQTLGEREAGIERLAAAVRAYEEALKEWTRETAPPQWAAAQHNLGAVLAALGTREAGTSRLEAAVRAFEEALKEYTREKVPLDWAMTQNNLGAALRALGEREPGTERLEAAVRAFEEALKERTRVKVPLDWAGTQNNLGNALWALGQREEGTARLEAAVRAYKEALKEWTRDKVPLDWAMTQNNLGAALAALGRPEAAVRAYEEALKELTREKAPLQWAATQNNLGNALQTLGHREAGTARLEAAVRAYEEALKELTRERVPLDWAGTQGNLANVHETWGDKTGERARYEQALAHGQAALEVFQAAGVSQYVAVAERNLQRIRAKLS